MKTKKLSNGKKVRNGDSVYFTNSDGIRCEGKIEKRKFKCFHSNTGARLKKGSLFFWNNGFEPFDYKSADIS